MHTVVTFEIIKLNLIRPDLGSSKKPEKNTGAIYANV